MNDDNAIHDAPFDEVETLAAHLCQASGGNWHAKAHKRGHWRKKAAAVIAAERQKAPEIDHGPSAFKIAAIAYTCALAAGCVLAVLMGAFR